MRFSKSDFAPQLADIGATAGDVVQVALEDETRVVGWWARCGV